MKLSMLDGATAYQLDEEIYRGLKSVVYRGHQKDGLSVILKGLQSDYPGPEEIARIQHEHDVLTHLDESGDPLFQKPQQCIPKVLGLEGRAHHPILVMEDQNRMTLQVFLAQQTNVSGNDRPSLEIKLFLQIAIQLVNVLSHLHEQQVIHKDINPTNILIHWDGGTAFRGAVFHGTALRSPPSVKVSLIDFGIASLLPREIQSLASPEQLEGTLAYIAPEQTGRMNRTIDYRADYYSLGVTFYEMLVGTPPFQSDDALELVHSHMTKMPSHPHHIDSKIPEVLANIILKLMAKDAEDRYQNSQGLLFDLEKCLLLMEDESKIPLFELGEYDVSQRFQIKEKLYGRNQEIKILLDAFERMSQGSKVESHPIEDHLTESDFNGGLELLLIVGKSGTGKSSLVYEVQKPMTEKRGYFISGKFDPYQKNIPYYALSQALNKFCHYLLSQDSKTLDHWKQIISEAVGENGQVLINLIPDLEMVIGKQPQVFEVGSMETQNRLNLVFEKFIKAIAKKDHPLVMFIDDLQWADSTSLNLLKLMILDPEVKYLLLIGAYRDNEVDSIHPLTTILSEIEKEKGGLNTIYLDNLTSNDINQLTSDTLGTSLQNTETLAQLIHEKTRGNAFFTIEFLKSLHNEGLLYWDRGESSQSSRSHLSFQDFEDAPKEDLIQGQWQWNIEQIKAKDMTDNVIELMVSKIGKLNPTTQSILHLAACIGNQFDLQMLTIINNHQNRSKTNQTEDQNNETNDPLELLWPSIEEGLILPLDNRYQFLEKNTTTQRVTSNNPIFRFAHDRIRQAVYSMLAENQKQEVHLKIGRLLLENTSEKQLEKNPFDVVNHWNFSLDLITQEEEKLQAAQLNWMAGKKAKQSSAFEAALNYMRKGAEILSDSFWQTHHSLMFNFTRDFVESLYLEAHFKEANQLYSFLLKKAQSDQEQYKVYTAQLEQLMLEGKYEKALKIASQALDILGIVVPRLKKERIRFFNDELSSIPKYLANRKISDLAQETKESGEKERNQLTLLTSLSISAYMLSENQLLNWATVKRTTICLQHGHNDISSYGYVSYGYNVLATYLNDYKNSYEYGKLALELSEKYRNVFYKGRTYFLFGTHINHWQNPLSENLLYLKQAIQYCLEGGDFVFAGYAIAHLLIYQIICGKELSKVQAEADNYLSFMKKNNYSYFENLFKPSLLQTLRSFYGTTQSSLTFSDPSNQLNAFDEQKYLEKTKTPLYLANFYTAKIRSLYLFGKYEEALQYSDKLSYVTKSIPETVLIPETCFFLSLTLTAKLSELLKQLSSTKTTMELDSYQIANAQKKKYFRTLKVQQNKMEDWAKNSPANYLHKHLLIEAEQAKLTGNIKNAMTLYKQSIASARKFEYLNNEALANELYGKFWLELKENEAARTYLLRAHTLYQQWGATAKVKMLEEKYPTFFLPTQDYDKQGSIISVENTVAHLDTMTVMKASQTISSEIMLESLLTQFMTIVMQNAGADQGILVMPDPTTDRLLIQASQITNQIETLQTQDIETSQLLSLSIVRYVSRSHESVVLEDASTKGNYTQDPYVLRERPKSLLCLPILKQGQLIGILYLENRVTPGAFTKDRLTLLHLLATQAAISIENAGLVENLEQQVQERTRKLTEEIEIRKIAEKSLHDSVEMIKEQQNQIEKELERARKLQKSLLPAQPSIIPKANVVCRFQPITKIGGDFYNIFHLKGELYGILLADVSGHGIPAALLSFMISIVFTTNAMKGSSPGLVLEQTNARLYERLPRGQFATMFYGIYHASNRTLLYSSGGHPPTLLIRPHVDRSLDNQIFKLDTKGGMVGCFPPGVMKYPDSSIQLQPEDKLLLYTDGVTEVKNDQGGMLKVQGLKSLIHSFIHLPIDELIDKIYKNVDHYNHIAEPKDDITLVGLEIEKLK